MAPRGRPRKGTSRMYAAIDAMKQLGFSSVDVRNKMKDLLRAYGGDDGYVFIEADSYRVLILALLGEEDESGRQIDRPNVDHQEEDGDNDGHDRNGANDQQEVDGENGDIDKYGSNGSRRGEDENGDTSTKINTPEVDITPSDALAVLVDNTSPVEALRSPTLLNISPQPANIPARRHKPYYGWISDEDEEPRFIILTPSTRPPLDSAPAENQRLTPQTKKIKRRTRWDLRPEDL